MAVVTVATALVLAAGALLSSGATADDSQHGFQGQQVGQPTADPKVEVDRDVSAPLRDIAPIAPPAGPPTVKHEYLMRPPATGTGAPDTVVQSAIGAAAAPTLGLSFDGIGQGFTGPAGTFTVNSPRPTRTARSGRTTTCRS